MVSQIVANFGFSCGLNLLQSSPKNTPIKVKNIAIVVPVNALKVLTTFIGISILSGFGSHIKYIEAIDSIYSAGIIYEIRLIFRNLKNKIPITRAIITDVI